MTNKERYQRAFSALHASGEMMEVNVMKNTKRRYVRRAVAICAAALVLALAGIAYAADVGGIRRTVQIWLHGDQTDAVLDILGSEYTLTYTDGQGRTQERGGGGVAFEADGTERALTEEEIVEQLDMPDVEYGEDGSVTVWWRGKGADITDKFENDICYVQLRDGGETKYLTVKYQDGYACSDTAYISPSQFNTWPAGPAEG